MTAITRTGCASPAQAVARDTSSDETLIGRIAGGDQLAMRTLFARHRVPIYRWLLRIVHDVTLVLSIGGAPPTATCRSCLPSIVLVALDVRLHVLRRHQSH